MKLSLITAVCLAACVAAFASPACAGSQRYDVTVGPALDRIEVRACFEGRTPQYLAAESNGARFYLESMRQGSKLLEPDGDRVALDTTAGNSCVEYAVRLQPAQTSTQTGGPETRRVGGSMLTAIGDWLWRDPEAVGAMDLRFRLPSGYQVSAPWPSRSDTEGRPVFDLGATPANWPGVVVFGRFTVHDIAVADAVLHVTLVSIADDAQARFDEWIRNAARNVSQLYGRFPVGSVQIVVAPTPRGRGPVPWAYVSRGGGPAIHLFVNPSRPAADFEGDWSLTHEMSHLFLPYVASRDAWLYEGVPTYLQNTLMARGSATSKEEAWRRMRAGFELGAGTAPNMTLTRANERIAYGGVFPRVYWAGAAIMLEADLQLRSASAGRQSLDVALDRLARCCASEGRRWTASEVIAKLDELTETTVFSELVRNRFTADGYPDYEAVLARAGVVFDPTGVRFDASAPWAEARDALTRPSY